MMSSFVRPPACGFWHEDSASEIEEASFLVLKPDAILYDRSCASFAGTVDIEAASTLAIMANFPQKPASRVAGFRMEDRGAALEALLKWKGTRPIFFEDVHRMFEYKTDSVQGLLQEMRFHELPMDELEEMAAQQRAQQKRIEDFFLEGVTVTYEEESDDEG